MTVLYLHAEGEIGPKSMKIPHDVICNILNEVELENDRCSEGKTG